jgi:hypothetical protein
MSITNGQQEMGHGLLKEPRARLTEPRQTLERSRVRRIAGNPEVRRITPIQRVPDPYLAVAAKWLSLSDLAVGKFPSEGDSAANRG